jgi:MFS family permease
VQILARLRRDAGRTYYGWWIVAGAIGLQFLAAGLMVQAFGTYVAVWQAEFGWSKTAFAVAFALQRAMMALLSPVQGWLIQRFGPRRVIGVGLVILAIGFVLLSRFETRAGFYLSFLVVALGVGLSGFLSLTSTIVNWFERRRASALALMQIGISAGGLAVPLVAWWITTHGWRATALLSAGVVLAVGLPLSGLMRRTPEAYGLRPDGASPPKPVGDPGDGATNVDEPGGSRPAPTDFRAGEALRTRAFWLITAGHAMAVSLVATIGVHIVVHLNEGLGLTIQTAATLVAVMTGAQMAGQLLGGVLGDRFPKRALAVGAMWTHALALVIVAYAPSLPYAVLFAVLHGLAWGVRGPIMQALRADYFGRSSFPTILGISFSFVMLGQMVGPLFAGALADTLGGYRVAFTLLAGAVAAASLCFVFAAPPALPRRMARDPDG